LTKKPRKARLWQFDPSVFQPGPRAGFVERHILGRARSLGKYSLYGLAFAYPVVIVSLGVMFGGLVFWSLFAGSMGLFWLVINKAGYSRNFANHDVGYRKFVGLLGAFAVAMALIGGLIYIRLWTVPVLGVALIVVLVIGIWKKSNI
jgi:hypothetical protein